jgi:hypothetical protein
MPALARCAALPLDSFPESAQVAALRPLAFYEGRCCLFSPASPRRAAARPRRWAVAAGPRRPHRGRSASAALAARRGLQGPYQLLGERRRWWETEAKARWRAVGRWTLARWSNSWPRSPWGSDVVASTAQQSDTARRRGDKKGAHKRQHKWRSPRGKINATVTQRAGTSHAAENVDVRANTIDVPRREEVPLAVFLM